MIKKLTPTRRVLFEKFSPSFKNIEYMVENALIDCDIHQTKDLKTFFYIKEKECVLEIQFREKDIHYDLGVFFNSGSIYYNLQFEFIELFLKKCFSKLYNIDLDKISIKFHTSSYKHVINNCSQIYKHEQYDCS
jgi:hypothetical protein